MLYSGPALAYNVGANVSDNDNATQWDIVIRSADRLSSGNIITVWTVTVGHGLAGSIRHEYDQKIEAFAFAMGWLLLNRA